MTGALRMTLSSSKQLLRGRDVLVAAVVVPVVTLGILALFADLDFDTGQTVIGLPELMITGAGIMMVAAGNTHAFVSEIATYKATGVLKRIAVTPISRVSFIIGEVAPRIAIGVTVSIGYLALGALTTDIELGPQTAGVLLVVLMITVTSLTWGFFVAGFTKTPMNANALDTFAMFWIFMLNGAMLPLAAFPTWLESTADYLPYTGLIQTVRGITVHGQTLADFGPELAIGAAWMTVLFVAATRTYRFTK